MNCAGVACRYVDVMNNRQTPDTSAGAFLTAVLEVQNKQWSTAKGGQPLAHTQAACHNIVEQQQHH